MNLALKTVNQSTDKDGKPLLATLFHPTSLPLCPVSLVTQNHINFFLLIHMYIHTYLFFLILQFHTVKRLFLRYPFANNNFSRAPSGHFTAPPMPDFPHSLWPARLDFIDWNRAGLIRENERERSPGRPTFKRSLFISYRADWWAVIRGLPSALSATCIGPSAPWNALISAEIELFGLHGADLIALTSSGRAGGEVFRSLSWERRRWADFAPNKIFSATAGRAGYRREADIGDCWCQIKNNNCYRRLFKKRPWLNIGWSEL